MSKINFGGGVQFPTGGIAHEPRKWLIRLNSEADGIVRMREVLWLRLFPARFFLQDFSFWEAIHMKTNNQINKTRNIAVTAIFSAMSAVLMFWGSFSIPLVPSFLKIDLSSFPALIASFSMGPVYGVAVCLVTNLVNVLKTLTAGVGELSNFILTAVFTATAGLVYKYRKNRAGALIGSLVGALLMSGMSIVSNYYIIYPIYAKAMPMEAILGAYQAILPSVDSLIEALLIFNTPFTFFKGLLSVIITFLVYKKISPIIKGKK